MKRSRAAGFTLIETVISMTLLSFITLIGYQGLVFGIEQWQRGDERMRFRYDHHQAISWIRGKIGTAEKVHDPNGQNYEYLFSGASQSLDFVARFDRARLGGLYVGKIFYDVRERGIYVSYYLHHPDVKGESASTRVPLLADVASVKFSYYGRKSGSKFGWHDSWNKSNTLPQLVRLEVESVDGVNHVSIINVLTSNNV